MVLDTETVSDYVFNIGFVINNGTANIESGSFVVKEIVENPEQFNVFDDRFMGGKKIARYYANLANSTEKYHVRPFREIQAIVNYYQQRYNCKVCAYNSAFDAEHLDITAQYFGEEKFFTLVKWLDIWGFALGSICGTKEYFRFVKDNELISDSGNPRTNAETVYRFLSDSDFQEEHTALADAEIESEILTNCLNWYRKRHAKQYKPEFVGMCMHDPQWRKVVNSYKAFAV